MMSPQALLATLLLAGVPLAGHACDRQLLITGVQPQGGAVLVAAYTDEASFMKKPGWVTRAEADGAELRVPLCALPEGEFAVMAFQDSDGNGKLNTNVLGMPQEAFGNSGEPARFGPPTWAGSKVTAAAGTSVPLKLHR